jgi:hypothetical protein
MGIQRSTAGHCAALGLARSLPGEEVAFSVDGSPSVKAINLPNEHAGTWPAESSS